MAKKFIGGSFAPPLSTEKLTEYRQIIEAEAPADLKDQLLSLCTMVETFQQTPESTNGKAKHPAGAGYVQPLEDAEIKRIWDVVPWDWEIAAIQSRCDQLPAKSPIRNAAFHLLWFAVELTNDREPCTNDKLG
jgi:hypothetical protein